MDGLLLDTERIYSEVTNRILEPYGQTFDWSLKSKMMGMRADEAAKLFIESTRIPMTPQQYLDTRNRMHYDLFPSAKPLPGVERLIKHLKAHNVPIAVATSSHRDAFELKTQNNKHIFNLFDIIVAGDDAGIKRGKPAPDIFLEAARQLGTAEYSKCLVFEDAPSGVEAALNAQMKVCWVPDPNVDTSQLKADQILHSLEHFNPSHWGLPQYKPE